MNLAFVVYPVLRSPAIRDHCPSSDLHPRFSFFPLSAPRVAPYSSIHGRHVFSGPRAVNFTPTPVSWPVTRKYRSGTMMKLKGVADESLKVMVVGSGGREHALAASILRSKYCKEVLVVPGNVGMAGCRRVEGLDVSDIEAVVGLAVEERVDLVVVGPEVPLVRGLVDHLQTEGILAFGPDGRAAQLEGSKGYAKEFMGRWGIPTARGERFTNVGKAKDFLRTLGAPVVVKADGLAAGKGVVLAESVESGCRAVEDMLERNLFGEAGREVVVEEFLEGEEVSFFALLDGKTALPLASAQDHKAAYDGDRGPNTGGMGAYSPAPICDEVLQSTIMSQVVLPTMRGMNAEGTPYHGVLYCGMIVDRKRATVKVLEFNVRFGDPECQVLCERLKTDMLELLYRTAKGALGDDDFQIEWHPFASMIVVLATEGYPGVYKKGSIIRGIDEACALEGVTVYHAGTARSNNGEIVNAGGRVLGITGSGSTIQEARARAYAGVDAIDWPDGFWRRDIGWRALAQVAAR